MIQHPLEVRNSQTSNRIPTNRSIPPRARNDPTSRQLLTSLVVDSLTTSGGTSCDIVSESISVLVQPDVEETHGWLAGAETGVVEQTDNGGDDGRGGRGTSVSAWVLSASAKDYVVGEERVGGDVGEGATAGVEVGEEVVVDVAGDHLLEVLREQC